MRNIIFLIILIAFSSCSTTQTPTAPSIGDINMSLCGQIADNDSTYITVYLCSDKSIVLIKLEADGRRISRYTNKSYRDNQ